MRLLQTIQVHLEHFIIGIEILDLPQRQLSVQSERNLKQLKHLSPYNFNIKLLYNVLKSGLTQSGRVGFQGIDLDFLVKFESDHSVNLGYDLLVAFIVKLLIL